MDVFDNLKIINSLPKNIIDDLICDVDILTDAPDKFLDLVIDLELTLDLKARAEKAKKYIDNNNGCKEVWYKDLGNYLANTDTASIIMWRKLYVLERSIKPRFGDYYTWFERLKVFYNTNRRETNVVGCKYNGHTLYFVKGTDKNPTNHDKLVYGSGKAAADFYYFDNTIEGETRDKMVKVELKNGTSTLDKEIKKYKDNAYTYGATHVIINMHDQQYYMVDYTTDPATVTLLDIPAPTGLLPIK